MTIVEIMALVERTLSARFTPASTEGGVGFVFLSPYWDTQIVVGWRSVAPMGVGDTLAAMRATLEDAGLACADVRYHQTRGIQILLDRGAAYTLLAGGTLGTNSPADMGDYTPYDGPQWPDETDSR